ncbi:MAG: DUF4249 domain-containing protein [Bacteroidales bacterium]
MKGSGAFCSVRGVSILLALLFLSGCEEFSTIDMDLHFQPQLVVTGFVGADHYAMVYLQLTRHPLGSHIQIEEIDASVWLIENQNPAYPLEKASINFFTGSSNGTSFNTYELRVSSSWGVIHSEPVVIPQIIPIDSVVITEHPKANKNIKVFFRDPIGINYYACKVLFFDEENTTLEFLEPALLFHPSQIFNDIFAVNGRMEYDIPIYLSNSQVAQLHRVEVVLFHIEANAWLYFDSLLEAEGSLIDFSSEPTIVHSNMSNGLGVFGGFASDTVSVFVQPSYLK